MKEGLEAYLEELRQAGSLDSQGFFTLEQARALEKLRRYQLGNPETYALALVSSATAAGASRIDIEASTHRFFLRHNGRALSFEELATLFSSLLMSAQRADQAPSQELATALHSIGRLAPRRTTVVSSSPHQLSTLIMDAQTLQVSQARESGFEGHQDCDSTTVEVVGLGRSLKSRMLSLARGSLPEVRHLRQRCQLAPMPIFLGGELLNPKHSPGQVIALLKTPGADCLPLQWPTAAVTLEQPGPKTSEALLSMAPEIPSTFQLVVRGVAFPSNALQLPPGVQAYVCAPHLLKDLSQSQLVENEDYGEVVSWVRQSLKALAKACLRQPGQAPYLPEETLSALDYL